jgi:hypothetical protein
MHQNIGTRHDIPNDPLDFFGKLVGFPQSQVAIDMDMEIDERLMTNRTDTDAMTI